MFQSAELSALATKKVKAPAMYRYQGDIDRSGALGKHDTREATSAHITRL